MNSLSKLIQKIKGAKSLPLSIGIIILALGVFLGFIALGGAVLVFGLRLMGFEIQYTFQTILGSVIVLLSLRPFNFSGSKEK